MKTAKKIMVAVSVLALRSLAPATAAAQVVSISCPSPLRLNRMLECGTVDGRWTVRPNNNENVNTGCLMSFTTPARGQCILSSGGIPPAKSVRVDFTDNNVPFIGPGAGATVRRWRMSKSTTNNNNNQTLTFSPTQVANTAVIDIGARLFFDRAQVLGSYTGSTTVRAVEIP